MKKGCKYGTHRVLEPKNTLPQATTKIDNTMELYNNEILVNVKALNIDSASFTQMKESVNGDLQKIKERILEIVNERGKMQNPITGSGGMLIGEIAQIGEDLKGKIDLKIGDKIATLVSLSLTPLKIDKILDIKIDIDRVEIQGQAILFESGIYSVLPEDISETLALAALDVAGAPAQTAKMVKPGHKVLILGAAGKSGLICTYEAKKRVAPTGQVIGLVYNQAEKQVLEKLGFCHNIVVADARNALEVLEKVLDATNNQEVDISINCVNVTNTEMATILPVKDNGIAYFFSMATSFTKAALGAEGVGKDINMVIGNGYTKGHAMITLEELRENEALRKVYEELYRR